MELLTNRETDLRIISCHYGDVSIPVYVSKDCEGVFVSLDDLPTILRSAPDNTDLQSWTNLKKAIAQTLTNQS